LALRNDAFQPVRLMTSRAPTDCVIAALDCNFFPEAAPVWRPRWSRERQALRPIATALAVKPHHPAVLDHLEAVAVEAPLHPFLDRIDGRQPPFRAPQRVHRIRREIVRSGGAFRPGPKQERGSREDARGWGVRTSFYGAAACQRFHTVKTLRRPRPMSRK
jgi:hypothetical protein